MLKTDGWTPTDYRCALEAWRSTAPQRDSAIFANVRQSKPRHAAKALRLRPLLAFRDPPGDESLQTNWRTLPANDNGKPIDFFTERRHEVTPSVEEILRATTDRDGLMVVEFTETREARLSGGKYEHAQRDRLSWPISGDFEISGGKIRRLGRLHFSNGTHTERAQRRTPDGVEDFEARLPVGAMMFTAEKQTRERRSAQEADELLASNLRIAGLFGIDEVFEPLPSGRRKRTGKRISKADARHIILDALNGPSAPTIKKCPDGMPMATDDLACIFMSIVKRASAKSGASEWQDFASLKEYSEAWQSVIDGLPAIDRAVLEAAMEARSLAEIGRTAVHASEGYAERAGRLALEAANDNLRAGIEKIAA